MPLYHLAQRKQSGLSAKRTFAEKYLLNEAAMIVISQSFVTEYMQKNAFEIPHPIFFVEVDKGDAYVSSDVVHNRSRGHRLVQGLLKFEHGFQPNQVHSLPDNIDVLVVVQIPDTEHSIEDPSLVSRWQFNGWVRQEQGIEMRSVQTVPIREELFSRVHGLYETDVLKTKTVLIVGVGSGGSTIAIELAKAGVGNFILIDHDR